VSSTTKALYRERMSCSAVGAYASPEWKRPQHSLYCSPERQGHRPLCVKFFPSEVGSGWRITRKQ